MTKFLNVDVKNLSTLKRFGIKGSNAEDWLVRQGVAVPPSSNTWLKTPEGLLILRLGVSEFLLEDPLGGTNCAELYSRSQQPIEGAYFVARADASFSISGAAALNLLSELCTLDLRSSVMSGNKVVMTQMAGVSATVVLLSLNEEPVYRIWCDGTYGEFMSDILQEIAYELA